MLGVDPRAFRVAWTVFLAAALLWLLYQARGVLFVLVLAILFAYVIWPLVAAAERLLGRFGPRGRRLAALAVVYPVLIGVVILLGAVMAPQIAQQGAMLAEKTTAFARKLQQDQLLVEMSQSRGWSLGTLYAVREQVLRHTSSLVPYIQRVVEDLLRYLSNVWLVVLVPILAFFLLKDAERLTAGVEALAPQRRDLVRGLFTDLHDLLAQYMRALVLLSLLSFATHLVFFLAAGVPYALLLAALAGILEFIPMVGPLTAAGIILLASWLAGYPHLIWILVFLAAWRLVQDYVNLPWVMGSGVEMHPLLVIFGILAGAELAGVAGMFLSIPTMAVVRILLRRALGGAI
ncbi:MAG: AI-2E family transporter [Acidobacteria bacterium]|nr:AI-2E family transporter [Acidobacteriota bacterium]